MPKDIAIELAGAAEIGIDGARVAQGFGLDVDTFRRLMDERAVTLLCERGTGEDAGLYRASFYHGTKRVRVVVDGEGAVVPGGFSVDELPIQQERP